VKRKNQMISLVYLVYLICLVEQDKPNERNRPEEPDQPVPPVSLGYPAVVVPSCPRSLSDIDRSTAANDLRPSVSFSALKNPQRIPANTPPVFPGLRPRI